MTRHAVLVLLLALAGCADPAGPGSPDASDAVAEPDMVAPDTSQPPGAVCGDGRIDPGEQCDGAELGGASCASQPGGVFDAGTLSCGADCAAFDTSLCTSSAMCGDGVASGTEVCDSADLRSESCVSAGFAGGTLGCAPDCSALDTSRCSSCGDGAIDATEECDGAALGGATCQSLDFDGGTLSCDADCRYALGECMFATCGNSQLDGGESCEGSDLGGQSCEGLGLGQGTLSCRSNCTFETSGCASCGDGVISGDEVCDGSALDGQSCASQGFSAGVLACGATCTAFDTSACSSCGNALVEGSEDCDGADLAGASCASLGYTFGSLGCSAACAYHTSGCVLNDQMPGVGGLVITEIMVDPDVIADSAGEYFEVYNPSSSNPVNLKGCVLGDDAGDAHTVSVDLLVAPGSFASLARSAQPGFTPDYVYSPSPLTLNNTSDTLRITCKDTAGGDVVVDEVSWDGGTLWPREAGFSMSLGLAHLSATANDDGLRWCNSAPDATASSYDGSNFGSPGQLNFDCRVGWCIIQYPIEICPACTASSLPQTVYGRVFADGATNMTQGADSDPRLVAELGYGPFGDDPVSNTAAFTWLPATANAGFLDPVNDEFQADLPALPTGLYSYFYRFSYDGGQRWQYCDDDGATPQGAPDPVFDHNEAGLLEVP